jgi:hypothetical protein
MTVRTGDDIKRFDIKLAEGQVILPVTDATCRVDIELTEMRDPKAKEQV